MLPAMLRQLIRNALLIRISEISIPYYPGVSYVILGYLILQMGYLDSLTLVQSTSHNLSGSVKLDLDLLKLWRVSTPAAARHEHAFQPVKHMSQQQQSQVWL